MGLRGPIDVYDFTARGVYEIVEGRSLRLGLEGLIDIYNFTARGTYVGGWRRSLHLGLRKRIDVDNFMIREPRQYVRGTTITTLPLVSSRVIRAYVEARQDVLDACLVHTLVTRLLHTLVTASVT